MNSAIERLISLRVKDVMNDKVMTIAESDDLPQAAAKLFAAQVSGAPVVDDSGRCVGVLSAADYVAQQCEQEDDFFIIQQDPGEPGRLQSIAGTSVSAHMSPIVETVPAEATILQAARTMCQEHIHRLVVVDEQGHPIGILTTLDLVASMVAAVEE